MRSLLNCFSLRPKICQPTLTCEVLCDDDIDGRYQVIVVRHQNNKCLEVIVVSKETGNEAPRLYLSLKKMVKLITKLSKGVKLQSMAYDIRKSIIDWLLVDFILSRLSIEEHGRKKVLFVDLLLHIEDMYVRQNVSTNDSQVLPFQTSSLSISKPADLSPFNFELHWLQKNCRGGNSLRMLFASGTSNSVAQQRWKWAIRRVLFNNLQAKIIHRLLSSSSLSSKETLSGRAVGLSSFDTCDSKCTTKIIDSPLKIKPTISNDSKSPRKKMSTFSSNDEVFFSANRFRHLFE